MTSSLGKLPTNPSEPLQKIAKKVIKAIVSDNVDSIAAVTKATKEMWHIAVDGYGIAPGVAGMHTLHFAAFDSGLDLNGAGNTKQVVTLNSSGSATLDGASSTSCMMTPSGALQPAQEPPFRHLDSNTAPKKRDKAKTAAHQHLVDGHKYVEKTSVDADGVRTINISASIKELFTRRQIVQHNMALALAKAISDLHHNALKNASTGPNSDRL
mmetsp:Transcript_6010/g.10103  ORF Transcript_6010/g.10103 Transcript_6010/m.10103 type:complete len:212 (+) Transcript_6010:775-1410(+)